MNSNKHITKYEIGAFKNDVLNKFSNYAAITVSGTTPITSFPTNYGLTLGDVDGEINMQSGTIADNKYATRSDVKTAIETSQASKAMPDNFYGPGFTIYDQSIFGYTPGYINCPRLGSSTINGSTLMIYCFANSSGIEVLNSENLYYYLACSNVPNDSDEFQDLFRYASIGYSDKKELSEMPSLTWVSAASAKINDVPVLDFVVETDAVGEYFNNFLIYSNRHVAEKDIRGCFLVDSLNVSETGQITVSGGVSDATTILFENPTIEMPESYSSNKATAEISFYVYDCSINSFIKPIESTVTSWFNSGKISSNVSGVSTNAAFNPGTPSEAGYWYYTYGSASSPTQCKFGDYFNSRYNIFSPSKVGALFSAAGSDSKLTTIGYASGVNRSNTRSITVNNYGKITVKYSIPGSQAVTRAYFTVIHDALKVNDRTLEFTVLAKDTNGSISTSSSKTYKHTLNYDMSSANQNWGFTASSGIALLVSIIPSYTSTKLNPWGSGPSSSATIISAETHNPEKASVAGLEDGGAIAIQKIVSGTGLPSNNVSVDITGTFTTDWNRCIGSSGNSNFTIEEADISEVPGDEKVYNITYHATGCADASTATVSLIPYKPLHTQWGTEVIDVPSQGQCSSNAGYEGYYAHFLDGSTRLKVPSVTYTSSYSITIKSAFAGTKYTAPNYIATNGSSDTWSFSSHITYGTMVPNITINSDGTTVSVDSYTITFTAAEMNEMMNAERYDFYYGTLDANLRLS